MEVLKVHSTSLTSSFRFPHIHIGELPTYDMPPPSTIYGILSAVLGEVITKEQASQLDFAYIFTYKGKEFDCETLHSTEISSGKMEYKGKKYNKNIEITTNVQKRQFLFDCDFKLYLKSDNRDLLELIKKSFLSTHFAYVLGRSQDLATCHSAEFIDLEEKKDNIFIHNSLIPFNWRQYITVGEPVMMVNWLDYDKNREPSFKRYLQLLRRPLLIYNQSPDLVQNIPDTIYSDTTDIKTFDDIELTRALVFQKLFDLSDIYATT